MSENIIKRCQQLRRDSFFDYKIFSLHWHKTPPLQASFIQRQWLNHKNSLTSLLSELGHIKIKLIQEKIGLCSYEEATVLQCRASMVWFREIIILLNAMPVVVARSITPLAASRNDWAAVRQLGNRPLACLLYQNKTIQRSPFAFQLNASYGLEANTNLEKTIYLLASKKDCMASDKNKTNLIISRRSIFLKNKKPLIVTESFLPNLWNNFVL